ncbi:hypothetical protein PHMEG_0003792 [Phytophthora megakarya]|uniref:Glucose-methanol-choline oxidoreductase N-terminal domain-containing protein n=1 Tax=Phytophthora megakarya TaxID=4795 RepID=A0A225WVI9_9STRA|nr:hypothetical protein PHMEG_0003792 [Phytophthora megakarya]
MSSIDERSPLLRPGASQHIGRRTRLLVSGLALLLLFVGAVGCVAIMLRLLRRFAAPPLALTPLVHSEEVRSLKNTEHRYDAIVIGGGPAGSVVAKLLSDDPWRRVLLIEAGNASQAQLGGKASGDCDRDSIPSPLNTKGLTPFDVPFYWTNVANTPSLHWAYPDVNVAKALGGCGIHNAMLYVRALPSDMGRWKMAKWTWEKAAAKTFLGPILDSETAQSTRSNFRLMLDTTVTKISINDKNVTEGAEVRYGNGTVQLIRLAKHGEVIVTAGAINTPKILMLSGLGHRDTLKKAGLPLKKHLPRVGMNLQDHPVVGMIFECKAPRIVDLKADLDSYFKATNTKQANISSFGLFGSAGIGAGAFLIPPGSTIPEIQLTLFPRKSEPHMSTNAGLNHLDQIVITIALLHPLARNRVVLIHDDSDSVDDNDIDDHLIPRIVSEVPEAKPEHLRQGDVWKISWAIGVVREIAAKLADHCNSLTAEKNVIGRELSPGEEVASSKDLNGWVFDNVFRNSHWVGTASMAKSEVEGVQTVLHSSCEKILHDTDGVLRQTTSSLLSYFKYM